MAGDYGEYHSQDYDDDTYFKLIELRTAIRRYMQSFQRLSAANPNPIASANNADKAASDVLQLLSDPQLEQVINDQFDFFLNKKDMSAQELKEKIVLNRNSV